MPPLLTGYVPIQRIATGLRRWFPEYPAGRLAQRALLRVFAENPGIFKLFPRAENAYLIALAGVRPLRAERLENELAFLLAERPGLNAAVDDVVEAFPHLHGEDLVRFLCHCANRFAVSGPPSAVRVHLRPLGRDRSPWI